MQIHHAQAISWLTELAGMTPSRTYSLEDIYYAYFLLGKSYENGFGVRIDPANAFKNYAIAAIENPAARLALGRFFLRGSNSIPKDTETGYMLIYSAYLKDPSILSDIQQTIVTSDHISGLENFMKKQAELGDSDAYYFLGSNMLDGTIFAYQKNLGMQYLQKALDMKNPYAFFRMAEIYEQGLFGESIDTEQALSLYEQAAGYPQTREKAARRLADFYQQERDYEKAFDYYVMIEDYASAKELLPFFSDSESMGERDLFIRVKDFQ